MMLKKLSVIYFSIKVLPVRKWKFLQGQLFSGLIISISELVLGNIVSELIGLLSRDHFQNLRVNFREIFSRLQI